MMTSARRYHTLPEWRAPWAALTAETLDLDSGRGSMRLIHHPRGLVIERQYRHGGLRRLVFPRVFFKTGRARREFRIHRRLYEEGLPVVEPIGWAEHALFPPFLKRYFFFTRFLEGSEPLPAVVRRGALRPCHVSQIAEILWRLRGLNIFHADLNLNNWLVLRNKVYLIDFDKADRTSLSPRDYVVACVSRIARSGRKLGLAHGKAWFFRLVLEMSGLFGVSARDILGRLSPGLAQTKRRHAVIWALSGGRRGR